MLRIDEDLTKELIGVIVASIPFDLAEETILKILAHRNVLPGVLLGALSLFDEFTLTNPPAKTVPAKNRDLLFIPGFAEEVKMGMIRKKLTRRELAKEMEIPVSSINNWIHRSAWPEGIPEQLAKILDIDTAKFGPTIPDSQTEE